MKRTHLFNGCAWLVGDLVFAFAAYMEIRNIHNIVVWIFCGIIAMMFVAFAVSEFVRYARVAAILKGTCVQATVTGFEMRHCHGTHYLSRIRVRFVDKEGKMREGTTKYIFSIRKAEKIQRKKIVTIGYRMDSNEIAIADV